MLDTDVGEMNDTPKVLVVDENSLFGVHEEIVTATHDFTVEDLERTYATLAKVQNRVIVKNINKLL